MDRGGGAGPGSAGVGTAVRWLRRKREINLLPPEAIEERRRAYFWKQAGVIGAACVICLGGFIGYHEARLRQLEDSLQRGQALLAAAGIVESPVKEVRGLEEELEVRKKKIEALQQQFPAGRHEALAKGIGSAAPRGVALHEVMLEGSEVRICGQAPSYGLLAEFIEEMEGQSLLREAVLQYCEYREPLGGFAFEVRGKRGRGAN